MGLYLHEPQKLRYSFLRYRLTPHTPKGIFNRIGINGSCLRKPTVFSDVTTSVQSVENGHSKTPMNVRMWVQHLQEETPWALEQCLTRSWGSVSAGE